jgi:hypothetical protein
MSLPPTITTSPSQLDGTVAGLVITAVVAALGLVMLIGLVYWADSHPANRKPPAQRPGKARSPAGTSGRRRAAPIARKPGSVLPQAPRASSPAQARDPEPAASSRPAGRVAGNGQ